MKIRSPLSDLRELLSQVREVAATHQTPLAAGEAATRAALIDPVLRALGWDVANPNMVDVERTVNSKRADYALRDSNGSTIVIVEAKKLNGDLSQTDYVLSLPSYAHAFHVSSVFITNGMVWHHYKTFDPKNFQPSQTLNLKSDEMSFIAAYLVQELDAAKFWPQQPDVDVLAQEVEQLRSDLSTLQQQVVGLARGRKPPLPPPRISTDMVDLASISVAKNTRPSAFRLPNGEITLVKYWRDVLLEACKFVLAKVPDIKMPLVDSSGMTINLLDVMQPAKDVAFVAIPYHGQNIYVYLNYDAKKCITNALYVLDLLPLSEKPISPAAEYGSI